MTSFPRPTTDASPTCFLCSPSIGDDDLPFPSPDVTHSSFAPDAAYLSRCALELKAVHLAARKCDEEIVVLRNLLSAHITKRKQLHERSVNYHSIMSPIRRLPKEILIELFSHCLKDFFRLCAVGSYGFLNEPAELPIMTLLRVCSHWRSIILATATLWAQFDCKLDTAMESGGIGLKCLEMHLERSRDAPLSFWVEGEMLLPGHLLIGRLLQEKRRWRHVSFMCKHIAVQRWDIPADSFPDLQRFYLDSSVIVDEESDATTLINFSTGSMRYLDISPDILRHAIFPFESLASLVISHYHSSALIAKCLFECGKAENLEYLEFWQGRGCDDDDDFDYGSVTTPKTLNIKALTILFSDDSRCALLNLLSTSFHLPRLRTFKLGQTETLDTATREGAVNKTVAFLDTVDNLKSLSMHGIPMTDSDVLQLLDKTPLLEEVSFTFMREESGPEVLKGLTASTGASFVRPALPLLRGVNFYFEYADDPLIIALLDMLRSRLPFSEYSDTVGLNEVASLENIFIEFEKGSCSHDAARVIRNAAPSTYRLRWLDWKTFSLLKAGCKHRWVDVAGPDHSTLQHRSYFEIQ